ncbi:hypothetical protein [Flavobacterium sp. LC2016-13]|uniref:hypothetical protein n=1 Tax=Flavobacterium sp. LC2016-13 TaxID=2675875 RepID=UPI0012B7730A|nr:hypothetical protein [Flavobacterium sp. LC2016-13]MTD67702.1 hypothetical protein [Flavobacterium sp. LC2016-13]
MNLSDIISWLPMVVTGAAIPIITTFFNNKSLTKRDIMKYENDRKIATEEREFEQSVNYKENLIKTVGEIYQLLSYFEHNISSTKSLIESTKKLTPDEWDTKYENELEKLIQLKSIVIARLPDYYDSIIIISNLHNVFWGYQRTLLMTDPKENMEGYRSLTEILIETQNKARKEIEYIILRLRKYAENVNEEYELNM